MQIMRSYERTWQVFRFTVVPRSLRWFRIFVLPSVREEKIRHQEKRLEFREQYEEAEERLRELRDRLELRHFQRQVGVNADGIIGPRTIDAMRRVGRARHVSRHALKNMQID